LPLPRVQKFAFSAKKKRAYAKPTFLPALRLRFSCKNVTFMLYFYHKSLFLVKMICTDFSK